MLPQPRGFCFTGSCSYQVYCSSTHTHWIPLGRCCLRPKIMEVTMALLLTCIVPCRLQHRHRCLKLQMDGFLGLRWYWYTSTWMNRHVFFDQALLNAFHTHSVILCLLNTRYNNIIWYIFLCIISGEQSWGYISRHVRKFDVTFLEMLSWNQLNSEWWTGSVPQFVWQFVSLPLVFANCATWAWYS